MDRDRQSSEEKARLIVSQNIDEPDRVLIHEITKAIREAKQEATERAAKIADENGVLDVGHTNIRAGYAAAARQIAAAIRERGGCDE